MKTTKRKGRPRGMDPKLAAENGELLGHFLRERKGGRTKHGALVAAGEALDGAGGRYLEYEAMRKRFPRVLRELAKIMRDGNDDEALEWWATHILPLAPETRRKWEQAYAWVAYASASRRQSLAATM